MLCIFQIEKLKCEFCPNPASNFWSKCDRTKEMLTSHQRATSRKVLPESAPSDAPENWSDWTLVSKLSKKRVGCMGPAHLLHIPTKYVQDQF